jgi:pimeloyl-ACP methyl ester carboxylesterase
MGKILAGFALLSIFVIGAFVLIFTPPKKLCLFYIDQAGCLAYLREIERPLYGNVKLTEKTYVASSRNFRTEKKLEWLTTEGEQIQIGKSTPNDLIQSNPVDITILIHGFHGTDDTVASYFGELAPFLTGRGPNHPVVIYDWMSVAHAYSSLSPFESDLFKDTINPKRRYGSGTELNPVARNDHPIWAYRYLWESPRYHSDQANAGTLGADGFAALLSDLTAQFPKAHINVVAHSMGCYVVEQALRNHANVSMSLRNVVWLAPDVAADALSDTMLGDAVAKLAMLAVFFSRYDEALKLPSRFENRGKRLGAVGPVGAVPGNVRIYDETNSSSIRAALAPLPQKDRSVHGAFLLTKTGIPDAILKLLAAADGTSN